MGIVGYNLKASKENRDKPTSQTNNKNLLPKTIKTNTISPTQNTFKDRNRPGSIDIALHWSLVPLPWKSAETPKGDEFLKVYKQL